MHFLSVLAETVPVLPWDEWIQKYGLAIAEAIVIAIGFVTGKVRLDREVKREERASAEKDVTIAERDRTIREQRDDMRETTKVIDRLAAGIETRNQIERDGRGRRT